MSGPKRLYWKEGVLQLSGGIVLEQLLSALVVVIYSSTHQENLIYFQPVGQIYQVYNINQRQATHSYFILRSILELVVRLLLKPNQWNK